MDGRSKDIALVVFSGAGIEVTTASVPSTREGSPSEVPACLQRGRNLAWSMEQHSRKAIWWYWPSYDLEPEMFIVTLAFFFFLCFSLDASFCFILSGDVNGG